MSAPAQHHPHSDLLCAVHDVLDAARAADGPSLATLVGPTAHVCEPDHQIIAELVCPTTGMSLSLVVDLDTHATAAGGQLLGTFGDVAHAVTLDDTEPLLQAIADLHFTRAHGPF